MSLTAAGLVLWAAATLAWLTLPNEQEDRTEDRLGKDAEDPRKQGSIFSPATHGRVAGISRGGWWE